MSKVTREKIDICQERNTKEGAVDCIMNRIEAREAEWQAKWDEREAQYAELVAERGQ